MIQHEGVYGVIFLEDKILLVRKTRGPYEGLWDLPGGRLEMGESNEQALTREMMEETGIRVKSCRFLYYDSVELPGFHHTGSLYLIEEFDSEAMDLKIESEDVCGACWRSRRNLEQLTPFALNYLVKIDQQTDRVDHQK